MGHLDEESGLIKVSWSKVRLSEECAQKMHLLASGMKSPVSDVTIFFKGNCVDRSMRAWLAMEHPEPGWMTAHVDEIFDETEKDVTAEGDGVVRWKDKDQRRKARLECREAVHRLEYLLREVALPYDWQPAVRFKTPLSIPGLDGEQRQVLLVGEMDLLVREVAVPPKLRVWDLKMTKDDQYWRKTIGQMVFYAITCLCMTGQLPVEVGLLQPMVDAQPWISFVPSDEDLTQMYTRIVSVAHRVWQEEFSPKADNAGCDWCEVKHACAKFAPIPGTKVMPLFGR